ncbi:unnamed protein product, partial [Ixodes pacificus]
AVPHRAAGSDAVERLPASQLHPIHSLDSGSSGPHVQERGQRDRGYRRPGQTHGRQERHRHPLHGRCPQLPPQEVQLQGPLPSLRRPGPGALLSPAGSLWCGHQLRARRRHQGPLGLLVRGQRRCRHRSEPPDSGQLQRTVPRALRSPPGRDHQLKRCLAQNFASRTSRTVTLRYTRKNSSCGT